MSLRNPSPIHPYNYSNSRNPASSPPPHSISPIFKSPPNQNPHLKNSQFPSKTFPHNDHPTTPSELKSIQTNPLLSFLLLRLARSFTSSPEERILSISKHDQIYQYTHIIYQQSRRVRRRAPSSSTTPPRRLLSLDRRASIGRRIKEEEEEEGIASRQQREHSLYSTVNSRPAGEVTGRE